VPRGLAILSFPAFGFYVSGALGADGLLSLSSCAAQRFRLPVRVRRGGPQCATGLSQSTWNLP
jgi:hypothetical protein